MKPHIVLSSLDAERLENLMDSLTEEIFPGKNELEEELARADVVDPHEIPATVVTMNSTVRCKVEPLTDEFLLTLVYPKDSDAANGKISILTPVGSALLGLSEGDQIEWPKPDGGLLNVCIEEVIYQPERSGEYYR